MFLEQPLTPEGLEAIALVKYIEELGRLLNAPSLESMHDDPFIPRSPSPPPEYDKRGKRTNTRESRLRNELEVERTLAVRKALELIPDYVPPSDFTKLARIVEKYPIPVRDFPQINFVGLLLGPRGNALRRMEADSGARISIRGRGSVKEGSRSASTQQGQEEDLHCLVSATSFDSIQKAFSLIKHVVDMATQTPEHQNDFKRLQLRELAELNGTLRDYENQLCTYCGEPGHRKFACPQREAALKSASCRACGQQGHLMRDCDQVSDAAQPEGLQQFLDDLEDEPANEDVVHRPRPIHINGNETDQTDAERTSTSSIEPPNGSYHKSIGPSAADSQQTTSIETPGNEHVRDLTSSGAAGIASPVTRSVGNTPPGVASAGLAAPGLAPPGLSPSGLAPPGLAPPGLGPPGLATSVAAPPRVAPPGVVPPGAGPPGGTPPGVPDSASPAPPPEFVLPRVEPQGNSTLSAESQKTNLPPPVAWKPPTAPQ